MNDREWIVCKVLVFWSFYQTYPQLLFYQKKQKKYSKIFTNMAFSLYVGFKIFSWRKIYFQQNIKLYLSFFIQKISKIFQDISRVFQFLFFEYWSFNKFQGISKKNFYQKLKFLIFQEFLRLFQEKLSVQVISRVFQEKYDCLGN